MYRKKNTNKKTPGENVVTLRHDGGEYVILLPHADTDYIQKKIRTERRPYELLMLQDIQEKVGPDDLVLDIGANIGNHTLYLAAATGCKVIAFEPNRELAEALLSSIDMNGFSGRVSVHMFGLGKEESQGHFKTEIPDNLGAQSIELGEGGIKVMQLDSIKLACPVQLLKIDVEGMELDVLKGGEKLLKRDHPLIYVESQTKSDFRKIANYLDTLGYCYWDTFNATPTHLFRPIEQVDFDGRISRLQIKSIEEGYFLKIQLHEVRTNLDRVNKKYREAQERIEFLKDELRQESIGLKAALNLRDILQERLATEALYFQQEREFYQSREQELTEKLDLQQKQIASLQEELIRASVEHKAVQNSLEQLQERLDGQAQLLQRERELYQSREKELLGKLAEANKKYREVTGTQIPLLKTTISDLHSKLEKTAAQCANIEQRLIRTRASLTYQLGYQVKNAATSFSGFIGLPVALWRIFKQAQSRRKSAGYKNDHKKTTIKVREKKESLYKAATQLSRPAKLVDSEKSKNLLINNVNTKIKVACVMDEFTYGAFAPECNLLQLSPVDWKRELEDFNPQMLFIESAWRGKGELWGNKIGHNSAEIQGLIQWCKDRSIPTVFWNKEDPVHFQTFINTAKRFDYIFTTDIDCIHRYKQALGHEHVYFLPFACQPVKDNPIELYERKDAISFAGAYYARYPERTRDLENFLDVLASFRPIEIYDRNFGKDDPNYRFPDKYSSFIVGTLPFDKIDQAYKGYRYSINLNSIKQSQSMFARRVFELLASNTITISNFSRGLRLIFGDLVVTTDCASQAMRNLSKLADNSETAGKFRLAGLRKVMLEHTYRHRFNYVCSKIKGFSQSQNLLPSIAVFARVATQGEAQQIIDQFRRQSHTFKRLILEVPSGIKQVNEKNLLIVNKNHARSKTIRDLIIDSEWVALMSPEDYYGPNYLLDLAISTQYSGANLIGKVAHYMVSEKEIELVQADASYRYVNKINARQAIIRADEYILSLNLKSWLDMASASPLESDRGLAVDPYNYCREVGCVAIKAVEERVNDLSTLNSGLDIEYLQSLAESIVPSDSTTKEESFDPARLAKLFGYSKSRKIQLVFTKTALALASNLSDGEHEYLYAEQDLRPSDLGANREIKFYLDTTPGLAVSLVVLFFDTQKQRIDHAIQPANCNVTVEIPPGTEWLRLGLRVLSSGKTEIKGLVLGHRELQPAEIISEAEYLLLTNHYPSYDDLYRNAFVHSRVKAYAEKGVMVDVFRLRLNEPLSFAEFEGADVITGGSKALETMLSSGRYKSVLVHFLDSDMWSVLKKYIDWIKVTVWVHGAEIQPFHRREYNFTSEDERSIAKIQSNLRVNFWRSILTPMPRNLRLVFVSNYFANEVRSDLGIDLPDDQIEIIHNPIDTDVFSYQEKPIDQRKKILSIRPYASAKYANDLTIEAILILSKKPWFEELEINLIGDGKLFDETVSPVRNFKNVIVSKGFLRHEQIAKLHKEYGVFMCPTRMDAQGVSRDEAMSSGLVPITNAVAAIPEFVDETCGILAPGEDAEAMAIGITELYENPEKFQVMSAAAAKRVRDQSGQSVIIQQELKLFIVNSRCSGDCE